MRKRGKVDGNHKEIVEGLRKIGASVISLASLGKGVPDLLVGFRHKNVLFEVKAVWRKDGVYLYTPEQWDFMQTYKGLVFTVYTLEQAIEILMKETV